MESEASMSGLVVRGYRVELPGWPPSFQVARSRGQAIAHTWREYSLCFEVSFRDFLKLKVRAYRQDLGGRFGEPLTVCNHPAFYVGHNSQYIQFVRPDSDVVLNAHPLDVDPPEARRGTPYYRDAA